MSDSGSKPRTARLAALIGALAHEIKNPLSTIGINLSLLKEDWANANGPREERTRKRVDVLEREVRRLESILEEFLRYVRGYELDLQPTDINEKISEVLEFIAPEVQREKIIVRTSFAQDLPQVLVDRNHFRRILLNLLINARQAIGAEGGELILVTRKVDSAVEIEVIDTGCGMSPDVLSRCFEVFFSTKKGGTGLGLAMVRRIVEQHGGRIGVQSDPGQGTCFRIVLPAAENPAPKS